MRELSKGPFFLCDAPSRIMSVGHFYPDAADVMLSLVVHLLKGNRGASLNLRIPARQLLRQVLTVSEAESQGTLPSSLSAFGTGTEEVEIHGKKVFRTRISGDESGNERLYIRSEMVLPEELSTSIPNIYTRPCVETLCSYLRQAPRAIMMVLWSG